MTDSFNHLNLAAAASEEEEEEKIGIRMALSETNDVNLMVHAINATLTEEQLKMLDRFSDEGKDCLLKFWMTPQQNDGKSYFFSFFIF